MRSECRVFALHIVLSERFPHVVSRRAQPVDAQCQRRWFVVELHPLLGPLETIAIEPPCHEPFWMRPAHPEIEQYRLAIGGIILGYYAAMRYVPAARAALREGRAARSVVEVQS